MEDSQRKRVKIVVGNETEERETYLDDMGEIQLIRLEEIIKIYLKTIKHSKDVEKMQEELTQDDKKLERHIRLLSGDEDGEE